MAMLLQIPPPSSLLNIRNRQIRFFYSSIPASSTKFICRAVRQKETENNTSPPPPSSAEEVTKKYGLEVGLWKILSSKDDGVDGENKKKKSKTDEAKELLAKYGGAYLATSITLSLISFSLCYLLVTSGVDVQALLLKVSSSLLDHTKIMVLGLDPGLNDCDFRCYVVKVGISTNETGEKVGAFALAYAAHKAASPIRFPPTVALTPIVANWIGKKVDKEDDS